MKNYYTTLDIDNNSYIGRVFDSSNNQLLYTTAAHNTQRNAMQELDSFIDGTANNQTISLTQTKAVEFNETLPRRRCCGR
jgi:uncharacterized protein YhbP (UPF0306 family)